MQAQVFLTLFLFGFLSAATVDDKREQDGPEVETDVVYAASNWRDRYRKKTTTTPNSLTNEIDDNDDSGSSSGKINLPNCGATSLPPNRKGRVIGGKDADITQVPWVASMHLTRTYGRFSYTMHTCGMTILNDRWLLTAAHCVTRYSISQYSVVVGRSNLRQAHTSGQDQVLQVEKIVSHPKYNDGNQQNDIALVRTKEPIRIGSERVGTICLPEHGRDVKNGNAVVAGWGQTSESGATSPEQLKEARVDIITDSQCESSYKSAFHGESMVCAAGDGKRDTCAGDSGGPLVLLENGRATQVGITSFGYGCARKEWPGVYAEVPQYVKWIKATIY